MKRLLLVHNVYRERGGEEVAVSSEESVLNERGWQVERYERFSTDYEQASLLQKVLMAMQLVFSVTTLIDLNRRIRHFKPDVIHVHNLFPFVTPAVYWAASRHNIPVVQTLHNYRLLCVNGLFLQKGSPCERCIHGNVLHAVKGRCHGESLLESILTAGNLVVHRALETWRKKVDAFIALSQFSKSRFVDGGLPTEKIHVLPNWIDVSSYPVSAAREEDNLVFVGRLSQEKGVRTLLNAHALFSRTTPNVLLHIVGDGPLANEVTAYIKNHPEQKVIYHGRLQGEEKIRILSNASALVFPSECYENCPYTILESLAVGTPVLATRSGGIPEIVAEGKTGFLFQPANAEDMAAALLRFFLAKEQWSAFRQNARNDALLRFDAKDGIERLERLFAIFIQRPL